MAPVLQGKVNNHGDASCNLLFNVQNTIFIEIAVDCLTIVLILLYRNFRRLNVSCYPILVAMAFRSKEAGVSDGHGSTRPTVRFQCTPFCQNPIDMRRSS